MTSGEEWRRVTAMFDELVNLPTGERDVVLLNAPAADHAIVVEVRSLLNAHLNADGRLDRPSALRFSPSVVAALTAVDPVVQAGRVGAYNIVRKIAEGGMGAVYEATRADAVYEQRVAIKTIAGGADNAIIAARFRRERQILAGLQHPNIAVLLDGGVTDFGTPYFVMEYVDGLPIDDWCRTHGCTLTQRLDLMQQVCRAVQHAHQRLVVHRDLKPQNVFVSNEGAVKLLDFGIAKLAERAGMGDDGVQQLTQDGPSPLTAAYASPEHLRGEAVSTASDVYSLGVILYELLAGVPPHPRRGRTAAQLASYVLTTSPPTPSVACTDDAARACGAQDRRRLSAALAGELDAIVMMAMRREPERRYTSAEALGADLQRHLRRLPVSARADSLSYRTQRFVRRNRWPVAVSAILIVVAIIAGVTAWQESAIARLEARRTARVAAFLQGVLGSADVRAQAGVMPRLGPNVTVSVLLDSALQRVATEFPDDPTVRARLYLTIGASRISQSRMRGASQVLDSAIALFRIARDTISDEFVLANLNAGSAALHGNRLADARALTRSAARTLVARGDTSGELYAHALGDLSAIALVSGAYDTMESLAQRALDIEMRRTPGPTIAKGVALNRLGMAAMIHDQWQRSDTLFDKSRDVLEAIVAPSNLERVDVTLQRVTVGLHLGRVAEADSLVSEELRTIAATFGSGSREYAMFLEQQVAVATVRGNGALARAASQHAVHIIDSLPDVISVVRAGVYASRAAVLSSDLQWAASDSLLARASAALLEFDRGIPVMGVCLQYGLVLIHENELAAADNQLTYAERAFKSAGVKNPGFEIYLHTARAYLNDRAGDPAAMARETAQVPVALQESVRGFVAKQRTIDARDAAPVPHRKSKTAGRIREPAVTVLR